MGLTAARPSGGGGETRERILVAAEDLLRRHGPAKTNVSDVARALGMSHANVYRHFASKAELRDAVVERWLARVSGPLAAVADGAGPPEARLRAWVHALVAAKHAKVVGDPELFATFHGLAEAARGVVDAHVAEMAAQLARIVEAGVRAGAFAAPDAARAARAVLVATAGFHHPHHVREAAGRPYAPDLDAVLDLLVGGLRSRPS